MKKIYLILLLLAFFLQFSFFPLLGGNFQIPNLILIVVTIIGVRKTSMENWGWFLLAGAIFEIFSVDFFGFNLILFSLTGGSVWFLKNIILNKEKNIFIEIVFWFLVKVVWDLFYKVELFLSDFIRGNWQDQDWTISPSNYSKEVIIFVLIAILIKNLINYFQNFNKKV